MSMLEVIIRGPESLLYIIVAYSWRMRSGTTGRIQSFCSDIVRVLSHSFHHYKHEEEDEDA